VGKKGEKTEDARLFGPLPLFSLPFPFPSLYILTGKHLLGRAGMGSVGGTSRVFSSLLFFFPFSSPFPENNNPWKEGG